MCPDRRPRLYAAPAAPDLIVGTLGVDGVFVDERGDVMEPIVVEQRRLLALRCELLALVEFRGDRADGQLTHSFVAWCRAHRARYVDGMIAALQPDLLMIDHRPLGWPEIDRYAIVSLVREQPDVEHGVLLAERIVAVNDGGLVNRGSQWQFGADTQLTMLIWAYYVVIVRDGRIGPFEGFPDDDPAPAIGGADLSLEHSGSEPCQSASPQRMGQTLPPRVGGRVTRCRLAGPGAGLGRRR